MAAISLWAAPQAVVFDFGGVMTKKTKREVVHRFLRESLHLSEVQFEEANLARKEAMRTGKTYEEFWLEFIDKEGIFVPEDWREALHSCIRDAITINSEMYALVDCLKEKQIPVALLSNIDDNRLVTLLRDSGLYAPFNPCLLSCEIGVDKPDPKAYEILVKRLKLPPQEIVFIDDKRENVAKAKDLGIDAILFESVEQIRYELQGRGLL